LWNQAVGVPCAQVVIAVCNAHWSKGITSDYFPTIQWHVILHAYPRLGRIGHGHGLPVSASAAAGHDEGNRYGNSRQSEPGYFMTHSMSSPHVSCVYSEY